MDEEIKKYRQRWNPFSDAPLFIQPAYIHQRPKLISL